MKIIVTTELPVVTHAPYPNTILALRLRKLAKMLEAKALLPIRLYEDGKFVAKLQIVPETLADKALAFDIRGTETGRVVPTNDKLGREDEVVNEIVRQEMSPHMFTRTHPAFTKEDPR